MRVFTLDHHHGSSAKLFSLSPQPYVLLYTDEEKTELFHVASDSNSLRLVGALSTTFLKPTVVRPVITPESTLAIAKFDATGESESELHIVSLEDARSLRIIPLGGHGNLAWPLLPSPDHPGRLAMSTVTDWVYSISLLDTNNTSNTKLDGIAIPSDLPTNTHLTVLHYPGDGLVFAALPFVGSDTEFSLVLWRNGTLSDVRLALPFRQPNADMASITAVASPSPTSFLFATDETYSESIETKHTRGGVVRSVSLVDGALKLGWESPLLGGHVTAIVPVPSLRLVVVFGTQNQREDAKQNKTFQFVAVLDAKTSELKRREDIRATTAKSSLGVDGETLVLYAVGKVMIRGILEFVAQGLSEGEMIDGEVVDACVVGRGVVVLKKDAVSFVS
ncbi:hypothetical protein C8R46DRAFT_1031168 [Mycena filopes]|nr:hypothetical protein C8R46DRAFT_1031168 [Mycena filopes]